jgi:hypothetical protein
MLMDEILDDSSSSSSSSSSNSSDSSMNTSSDSSSDEDEEMLLDEFHVALFNSNMIARQLDQTIAHEGINWRTNHTGLSIQDLSVDDALSSFRFRKEHLQEVSEKLWPRLSIYLNGVKGKIVFGDGRYSAPYETLFLLVLYRLARPKRIRRDMEEFFGFRRSKISAGIKAMASAMHTLALKYLDDPSIFLDRMPRYAEIINEKCGLVNTVWGFIDGTLRKTCRPTYFQKLMYSGHKRAHGMKFQSVVTPDGLFACMFGAVNGNRHDSHMLNESLLLPRLQALMPAGRYRVHDGNGDNNDDPVYSLYADPAYPQSAYVFGGFRNPAQGSREALWNSNMSSVRESVEWGFSHINKYWAFLNFHAALKVFQSPVAKYYIVATFLCNLRTCYYGNQTMSFFECASDSLTIDEYLALID